MLDMIGNIASLPQDSICIGLDDFRPTKGNYSMKQDSNSYLTHSAFISGPTPPPPFAIIQTDEPTRIFRVWFFFPVLGSFQNLSSAFLVSFVGFPVFHFF
jgi:hypothetical protein